MQKYAKFSGWFALFVVTVLAFENCGKPILRDDLTGEVESPVDSFSPVSPEPEVPEETTGDQCEDIYLKEFLRSEGYYQFVARADKCLNCHNGSNTVAPYFAHSNKLMAFEKFREKEIFGNNSISARAVSNHQPGITGDMNVAIVDELKLGFSQLKSAYETCKGIESIDLSLKTQGQTLQKAIASNSLTADDLITTAVQVPSLQGTTLVKDTAGKVIMLTYNVNKYQRVVYNESTGYKIVDLKKYSEETYSFDLNAASYTSNVANDSPVGTLAIKVKPAEKIIETKKMYGTYNILVGVTQTLQNFLIVSKPTFKLPNQTAEQAWNFKNLSFYINDSVVESATIYQILDANICGASEITVMDQNNSALLVFSSLKNSDVLSLKLQTAKPVLASAVTCSQNYAPDEPLPSTMTWTELTTPTGVFGKNCLSCHSGTAPSAGFNIANYDSAKAKASLILSRMNDNTSPMPRSGLLDQRQRDLVELWINKGTPK